MLSEHVMRLHSGRSGAAPQARPNFAEVNEVLDSQGGKSTLDAVRWLVLCGESAFPCAIVAVTALDVVAHCSGSGGQ